MKKSRNNLRIHRKRRIKAKTKGVQEKPRLCIFRSLKNMSAQIIDDTKGVTLVSVNLKEIKSIKSNLESSKKLGELLAKKCLKKKITEVVYDRSGYKYHGNVKALAEGAREGGLKF